MEKKIDNFKEITQEIKKLRKNIDPNSCNHELRGRHFKDEVIDIFVFSDIDFHNCTFTSCTFEKISVYNVKFENCEFKNIAFNNTKLNQVYFRKSILESICFNKCKFKGVDMLGTRVHDSSGLRGDEDIESSLMCKYDMYTLNDGTITINNENKTIEEWDDWFDSDKVKTLFEDIRELKRTKAVYIAHRVYVEQMSVIYGDCVEIGERLEDEY